MINNILIAAAVTIPVTPQCLPILAEEVTSPKPVPTVSTGLVNGFTSEGVPPSLAYAEVAVANNIACRNAARAKFFELGARGMSPSDANAQFGVIGQNHASVWCRENRAFIVVAGQSFDTVQEIRKEISKAF
jgi:hypothetical protein